MISIKLLEYLQHNKELKLQGQHPMTPMPKIKLLFNYKMAMKIKVKNFQKGLDPLSSSPSVHY